VEIERRKWRKQWSGVWKFWWDGRLGEENVVKIFDYIILRILRGKCKNCDNWIEDKRSLKEMDGLKVMYCVFWD